MHITAQREFLRMWTQGLTYNYSSSNVLGAHEIIGVREGSEDGHEYTDVTVRSRYPMTVIDSTNGKPYKTQVATFRVRVSCDAEEIDDDLTR